MLAPEESFVCLICLTFESENCPDWFVTTPNGHVFHSTCLTKWMIRPGAKCPTCNENLDIQSLTRLYGIDPSSRDLLAPSTSDVNNQGSQLANPPNWRTHDYCFTICMVGNFNAGKTSLLNVFTTGLFDESAVTTVGSDLKVKKINLGGKIVLVHAWDTSGQERYNSISKTYIRKAHGIVLVYSYDMSENEIVTSTNNWLDFIRQNAEPEAAILLVGNKVDIPLNQRSTLTTTKAQAIARNLGLTFFETSAKDHLNVEAAFNTLVAEIFQRVQTCQLEYSLPNNEQITLGQTTPNRVGSKNSCCP